MHPDAASAHRAASPGTRLLLAVVRFRIVIDALASYALPFVITENGIADSTDVNRPRFLVEHL